jgi:hypothetical protein
MGKLPFQPKPEVFMEPVISVDLLEAARRSDSFPAEWPADKVQRALDRYDRFLRLIAKNPGMAMAPTRDIDEMWHLHMLSPRAYYEDCTRLFGYILDHDGGFGKEAAEVPALRATFERTSALWEAEYGEPYLLQEPEFNSRHGGDLEKCWHDCQGRCWHDCKSSVAQPGEQAHVAESQ